jgi:hypothetical protein
MVVWAAVVAAGAALLGALITQVFAARAADRQIAEERERRAEARRERLLDERRAAAARFIGALHAMKVEQTDQSMTRESRSRFTDAFAEVTLLFPKAIGDQAEAVTILDPHTQPVEGVPHSYDEAVDALVAAMKADLGIR